MINVNKIQDYEIKIDSHLSDQRSRVFNGLQVDQMANGETLIYGEFRDQAQLFGILILIRDMGIPLISVNRIGSETRPSKEF